MMELEITLKEKGERKLKELKKIIRELNDQLHLGASETREEFENQKKRLGKWVDFLTQKLDNAKDITKEKSIRPTKCIFPMFMKATKLVA